MPRAGNHSCCLQLVKNIVRIGRADSPVTVYPMRAHKPWWLEGQTFWASYSQLKTPSVQSGQTLRPFCILCGHMNRGGSLGKCAGLKLAAELKIHTVFGYP